MITYKVEIPLDEEGNIAVFEIKQMSTDLYKAAQKLIRADKMPEAIGMVLKDLHVSGDPVPDFNQNFIAFLSASQLVTDLITPKPYTLKKNSTSTPSQ